MDRLISEQAVLDLIADYDLSMGQVVKGIHALPSVNPQEPKTGHWILSDNKEFGKCNNCGAGWFDLVGGQIYNYCPECGCQMVESQESE